MLWLALLYAVLVFLSEFIGFIGPWFWMLHVALAAILAAWPVFKAIQKKGGKYVFLLFGVLLVLTYYLEIGEFTVMNTIVSLVIVIAAELIHRYLGYGSKKALRIAYPVFAFVPIGNISALWIHNARYCQAAMEEMGETYCEKMSHLGNFWTFAVVALAIVALSLVAFKLFYKEK